MQLTQRSQEQLEQRHATQRLLAQKTQEILQMHGELFQKLEGSNMRQKWTNCGNIANVEAITFN